MVRSIRKNSICFLILPILLCACIKGYPSSNNDLSELESTLAVLPDVAQELADIQLPVCVQGLDDYEIAYVTSVIDGDSIEVLVNGKEEQVRYIGMNTPEYYSDERDEAEEATELNRELVEGRYVLLIKDVSERDKFDRLLRYVFTEDHFVNYELVKEGVAEAKQYPPDTACHNYLSQAE
ncbi:MAG: thermonuclease family protein [Anaerolineaceae bacterium]